MIDTAECYLQSEELIGQAVAHRRGQFYLFTKCGHPESPSVGDWRPESLLASIERSLQRLKTNCVDLVQLHSCSENELRKGDVIAALQQARAKGHTRYIGYSGDGSAARFAIECGAFDTLQTSLNIADQEAIELTLPAGSRAPTGRDRQTADRQRRVAIRREAGQRLHPALLGAAPEARLRFPAHRAENAAAIALRFTLSVPGLHTAIVGTANPTRWRQNAAILAAGRLDDARMASIRGRWKSVAGANWGGQT